ncbi:MAG: type II toxin-antitoxin system RelE/ParE family toxin [Chitinophagales bacterium]
MAKEVIWSPLAKRKRNEILEYWIEKNKSNHYSIRLNNLFKSAEQLISIYPSIGKLSDDGNARFKIVRDYLMFYEQAGNKIYILTIWDSRQDPENLTLSKKAKQK